ncbi:MAG: hypothetical protein JO326_02220 [Acetobacteraceae bacterium]|nr:hypothetical protein [Acetobacteraceae bacterium]
MKTMLALLALLLLATAAMRGLPAPVHPFGMFAAVGDNTTCRFGCWG